MLTSTDSWPAEESCWLNPPAAPAPSEVFNLQKVPQSASVVALSCETLVSFFLHKLEDVIMNN